MNNAYAATGFFLLSFGVVLGISVTPDGWFGLSLWGVFVSSILLGFAVWQTLKALGVDLD